MLYQIVIIHVRYITSLSYQTISLDHTCTSYHIIIIHVCFIMNVQHIIITHVCYTTYHYTCQHFHTCLLYHIAPGHACFIFYINKVDDNNIKRHGIANGVIDNDISTLMISTRTTVLTE